MDSTGDREEISPSHPGEAVEYFFASDASAIIEHTNRVIFLEDDDVASVSKGNLILLFQLVATSILKSKN
jgi:glucosamine--fructose-6-phosphate aminotransferase (isomerizing)